MNRTNFKKISELVNYFEIHDLMAENIKKIGKQLLERRGKSVNEINSKSFNINIDKPTIADLEVYFQKHSASLDALRQSMQKATEKIVDLKANETAT